MPPVIQSSYPSNTSIPMSIAALICSAIHRTRDGGTILFPTRLTVGFVSRATSDSGATGRYRCAAESGLTWYGLAVSGCTLPGATTCCPFDLTSTLTPPTSVIAPRRSASDERKKDVQLPPLPVSWTTRSSRPTRRSFGDLAEGSGSKSSGPFGRFFRSMS